MTTVKTLTYLPLLIFAMAVNAANPAPSAASIPDAIADNSQALTAFEAKLQAAVEKGGYYPKEAAMNGEQGVVVVEFDYAGDGKATNVTLGATTASRDLNRAAIRSVENAKFPPKPSELAGVTHFHIKLTYTLGH